MLKNKIALITGAGRGIGRAIAIALAKEGAEVVINYNGSEAKADEVKHEIVEKGGCAQCMQCNVADYEGCEAFIKAVIEQFGRIDILVNNAGITKDDLHPFCIQTDDEAEKRKDHQSCICSWNQRKCRSGKLCCI